MLRGCSFDYFISIFIEYINTLFLSTLMSGFFMSANAVITPLRTESITLPSSLIALH